MKYTGNNSEFFLCENVSEGTTEGFILSQELHSYHLALAVVYLLFLVVGLPWNLLVVVTIVKEKLYTQPTIILLLNLVLTDLLVLLLVTPFVVVTGLAGEYVFGGSDSVRCQVCRIDTIVGGTLYYSGLFTVALLAFDRFFFIHKPLRYERLVTAKRMLLTVLVMWCGCALLAIFHLVLLREMRFDPLLLNCIWNTSNHEYFHILSAFFIILSYLVILVCNVWVVCIVLRNIRTVYKVQKLPSNVRQRRISREQMNSRMQHTRNRKQLHLMRVFGGIICSNTISWLPLVTLVFLLFIRDVPSIMFTVPPEYTIISSILFTAQVVIYPILETTLISDIRNPMKKMITCGFCRKDSSSGGLPKRQREGEWHCGCYGDDKGPTSGRGCLQFCNAIWLLHLSSFTQNTPSNDHTSPNHTPSNDYTPSEKHDPSTDHTSSDYTPPNVTTRDVVNKAAGHTPSHLALNTNGPCDHSVKDSEFCEVSGL